MLRREVAIRAPALVLAVMLGSSGAAAAEAPPPARDEEFHPGVTIGVRSGAALGVSSQLVGPARGAMLAVPVWLDLGYRATRRLTVALYAGVAPLVVDECSSCTGTDARLGLEALWRLGSAPNGGPWIGAGGGLDLIVFTRPLQALAASGGLELGGGSEDTNLGLELLQAQAGYDLALGKSGRIGPFLALTVDTILSGADESGFGHHLRGWGIAGLGGSFDP